jgi:hypothetical protein
VKLCNKEVLAQFHQQRQRGRGVISNKKNLKVLPREGRFFIHGRTFFCTSTSLLHNVTNKNEGGGEIFLTKKNLKVLCREGRFVAMDVLYLWTFCRTFCRLDVL